MTLRAINNPYTDRTPADREYDWRDDAACHDADPEWFYPAKDEPTKNAKEVCQGCSVREACLEWALKNNEPSGIWGGLSSGARKKLRNERIKQGLIPKESPLVKRNHDIIEARNLGLSPQQVAKKFDVGIAVVHRVAGPEARRAALDAQDVSHG